MGRKGTKAKKAAAKKQARALYKRRKRNAVVRAKNIRRNAPKSRGSIQDGLTRKMTKLIANFDNSGEATWWVGNILNYFASDYDEGVWSPVFPEIYDEGAELHQDDVTAYLTQHFNEEEKTWTAEGERAVAICMSPPHAIYAIAQKCLQGCQEKDPDAELELEDIQTAKNDAVWQVLDFMKKEITERREKQIAAKSAENPPEVTDNPEEDVAEDPEKAVEL
tara:strand:+ start:13304 stop:13966 length:663 start_codon:yes stop_codon:yes gene_type:complete